MKSIGLLVLLTIGIAQGAFAQELKVLDYQDRSQKLKGLITDNAGSSESAVLILPAWKGIDEEAKDAALSLAKTGYVAMIADIYGEGQLPADNTAAAKLSSSYKTDFLAYQHRIQLALDELKKQGAKQIAIIGYCFGGTGALEAARGGLDVLAVVCIHGSLSKASDRHNNPIQTKVLVQHPAADESVKKEHYDGLVQELNEGGADWQIITYANSKHTFTNPKSADYNEVMAKRAWNHLLLFLKEVLNN